MSGSWTFCSTQVSCRRRCTTPQQYSYSSPFSPPFLLPPYSSQFAPLVLFHPQFCLQRLLFFSRCWSTSLSLLVWILLFHCWGTLLVSSMQSFCKLILMANLVMLPQQGTMDLYALFISISRRHVSGN